MNYVILTYCLYLLLSISITVWVARKLFKHGQVFLVDIFHGNSMLAASVNHLLQVGFYLINLGYAVYTLQEQHGILTLQNAIERLSVKTGFILLLLGCMHFLNLCVFFRLRKKAQQAVALAAIH
jgi:hypothetical protein